MTSLTGKSAFKNNLAGKCIIFSSSHPQEIRKLKIKILDSIILPLLSKEWKVLEENMYCLESIKRKIDSYSKLYKDLDLLLYKEIVEAFEIILTEHNQLEELERKLYKNKNETKDGKNDLSSMVFKTVLIKLKPEYEIYNAIIGKPNRSDNQTYDLLIIEDIQRLLKSNSGTVTFQKIKDYITKKYNLIF